MKRQMPPQATTQKAKYWIATIPHHLFTPYLPNGIAFILGQLESGEQGGYLHWQLFFICKQQQRLSALKKIFGDGCHFEPTRSDAVEAYCQKPDTRVQGTEFELGSRPFKRNSPEDWARILDSTKRGDFDDIPADIYIRNYSSLKKIAAENARPSAIVRTVNVFCGATGTGKSRRAWDEAGLDAYPK